MKKANTSSGFTIVEIVIVVVIISTLATISFFAYNRVQVDARDSERSSKVKLIGEALERYFEKNGEYPSCAAMTQSGAVVAKDVLGGMQADALISPRAAAGVTNSITCTPLSEGTVGRFAYIGDSSSTCTSGAACLEYTLQYHDEKTGTIATLEGRHKTDTALSGAPDLSLEMTGTSAELSWTTVANAVNYRYQQATNSSFTSGLVDTNVSGLTRSVTGLTPNTTYYFRVLGIGSGGTQGAWSNVAIGVATIAVPTSSPTVTAALSSSNAVGTASVVACPAGTPQYQLRYRSQATTTSGAWSAWSTWTGSPRTYTIAASLGWEYDFQAQARCLVGGVGSDPTDESNIAVVVRPLTAPAAPTRTSPSQFRSGIYAVVNYSTSCPSGSTMFNGTLQSTAWTGSVWGPYPFGYNDYWTNNTGSNKTVTYRGTYQCRTAYSDSPISATGTSTVTVTPP